MADKSLDFNKVFDALFSSLVAIITACIAGILGSLISGAIFGFIAGVILETFYSTSGGMSLGLSYILSAIVETSITSVPFGILIGLVTGVHSVVFRLFRISSFFWAIITCLSAIAGLWFSSSHAPYLFQDVVIYLETAIVSFTTGWAAHRYANSWIQNESKAGKRLFLVLTGSISGSLIISSMACYYFAVMEYLQSIPS